MTSTPTLDAIQASDRAQLIQIWTDIFSAHPSPKTSQSFMRTALSFHIQSKHLGGLDSATKRSLKRLQRSRAPNALSRRKPKYQNLAAGAQILREWGGKTHRVEVLPDGYAWNGQTFKSLSAIATAITGTRWSGPRFFGLRNTPS